MSREGAEDIAQDVLLKMWNVLRRFEWDPTQSFISYLQTVTKNTLNDFWEKSQKELVPRAIGGTDWQQNTDIDELVAIRNVKERVQVQTWQAFYLSVVEKWPAKVVVEKTKMRSEAAVWQAVHRTMKMINEEYAKIRNEPKDGGK
jgi:DNA-directed RNA polymerase specialized sigma24 family protein